MKKLPLSLKLIVPLVIMQTVAMAIGIGWFTTWLEKSRLKELDHILDSQTDAIEDGLVMQNGKLAFDTQSELVRELFEDRNYYFLIVSSDGNFIAESHGPSEQSREVLRAKIPDLRQQNDKVIEIKANEEPWRVFQEVISPETIREKLNVSDSADGHGYLFAAISAGPTMKELSFVKRAVIIGTIILLCLTSLGTAIIVSHTTANLKVFAQSLEHVQPKNPKWQPPSQPKSSEEHLLFASFQTMITEIQKATEAQRLFVANASHELKTPISGLLMSLEVMLTKTRSKEEYEKTGRDLLKSVKGLKRLSTALLDLARIDDTAEIKKEDIDLDDLLGTLTDRWQSKADEKQIQVICSTNHKGIVLCSNRDLLEVAIGNFIDNAIKYSPNHSPIELTCGIDHDSIAIRVKDNGIGMSEGDVKRLGEVFFRANEARSDEMSYGLGYAQSDRIIKLLGGQLAVISQPNHGTTISLIFPKSV